MTARKLRFHGWLHWRIILVLCVTAIPLFFQSGKGVEAHHLCPQDPLPLVSLVSVTPSPVREGNRVEIKVRIDKPLPSNANEDDKIEGGVIVFDRQTPLLPMS